jgi:NADH:ubiquinone oxidoreductase subunit E
MENDIIEIVDKIVEQKGRQVEAVIPILQAIQSHFNYLPQEALERVCATTDITPSRIFGISTFYTQFRHKPVGKHIVKVCVGTACHVKGALLVYDSFCRKLHLGEGDDTDPTGQFTIEKVACLGCCTIAPVVQIDDITYGHVTSESVSEVIDDFINLKNGKSTQGSPSGRVRRHFQGEVRIGLGSCCVASGSAGVKEELEKNLERYKINVDVKHVGCVGICNQVPMLEVHRPGEAPAYYTRIKPEEVREVIRRHFKPTNPLQRLRMGFNGFFEKLAYQEVPKSLRRYPADTRDTPVAEFLESQLSIATENRGEVKPSDLQEYRSHGGFEALRQCVKDMSRADVIDIVKASGLRGRGGAGFPTGTKWQLVANEQSDIKYVICNGDEGDPGAFMDRMLLESYPYRVIEGMIIAAYAVGASEGVFYIRAEYPLALRRIREAIGLCEGEGLLGNNIFNSNFSFHVRIFEGAGAFVCGEETALIASVEGKRGYPTVRPPFPAQRGLWGKPTLINNTETLAMVSWIIRNSAEKFHSIGTKSARGQRCSPWREKLTGGINRSPYGHYHPKNC